MQEQTRSERLCRCADARADAKTNVRAKSRGREWVDQNSRLKQTEKQQQKDMTTEKDDYEESDNDNEEQGWVLPPPQWGEHIKGFGDGEENQKLEKKEKDWGGFVCWSVGLFL